MIKIISFIIPKVKVMLCKSYKKYILGLSIVGIQMENVVFTSYSFVNKINPYLI